MAQAFDASNTPLTKLQLSAAQTDGTHEHTRTLEIESKALWMSRIEKRGENEDREEGGGERRRARTCNVEVGAGVALDRLGVDRLGVVGDTPQASGLLETGDKLVRLGYLVLRLTLWV